MTHSIVNNTPEPVAGNRRLSLSNMLHCLGVMMVLAAMCAYLLEGWDTWNGVSRYFVMIAGTGLFAGYRCAADHRPGTARLVSTQICS